MVLKQNDAVFQCRHAAVAMIGWSFLPPCASTARKSKINFASPFETRAKLVPQGGRICGVSARLSPGRGRKEVAQCVSAGIENRHKSIRVPEGRQRNICRPLRGLNLSPARLPSADALGYLLSPLRGLVWRVAKFRGFGTPGY
jgi:hypothetical protein